MPAPRKALTDAALRGAKPRSKPYKIFAGDGLYLYISPAGGKVWRLGYRGVNGAKTYTMDRYPKLGLAAARQKALEVKADLKQGIDPIEAERARKAQAEAAARNSFRALAEEWLAARRGGWSARYVGEVERRLANDILPTLGARPIRNISALDIRDLLHTISARGAGNLAVKVRVICSGVFQHALSLELCETDPAFMARRAIARPRATPHPAALSLNDARGVLAAVEAVPTSLQTKLAHRLLALTAVRASELCGARWDEMLDLDGEAPLWTIPAERMKGKVGHKREHMVPLSPPAVAVLRLARQLSSHSKFVFPAPLSRRGRGMYPELLAALLRAADLPVDHVPHGWRATFSSIMNERHRDERDSDAIEAALAHTVGGVRGIYFRGAYLARRRVLMAEWADLLLKDAAPLAVALAPDSADSAERRAA
jgi:integrase